MAGPATSGGTPSNAPDGGWGWAVVFGSFLIHVVADGVAYTIGVYIPVLTEHFPNSTKSQLGWIGSIMVGVTLGSGPAASALSNRFGCRLMTIVGTLIASFGFFVTYFVDNVYVLYVTLGIIGGLGLGLMYLPAIVILSYYFEKRRAFATGLAVCGSGAGTFIFAPIIEVLVNNYGWRGAFLIESGLLLNCCVSGALFRPLPESNLKEQNINPDDKDPSPDVRTTKSLTVVSNSREIYKKDSICDSSVLKDLLFQIFAWSNFLTNFTFFIPFAFLPDRATTHGYSNGKGAFLVAIIGIFNTAGRALFGLIGDHPKVNRLFMYNTALVMCGIATCLSVLSDSYGFLAGYAGVYGLLIGVYVTLTPIIIVDLLGIEKLSTAFGIICFFQGIATMLGPPIAGYCYDETHSYTLAFVLFGILTAVSGAMLYPIPCIKRWRDKRKEKVTSSHRGIPLLYPQLAPTESSLAETSEVAKSSNAVVIDNPHNEFEDKSIPYKGDENPDNTMRPETDINFDSGKNFDIANGGVGDIDP